MTEEQLFSFIGRRLEPDAQKKLPTISLPVLSEPQRHIYKIQYVIELVGPSLLPGDGVRKLVEKQTHKALGCPEIFVKIPGKRYWILLHPLEDSLTYDSLAFAWDMVTPKSALSKGSAHELFRRVEVWGKTWERRAISIPHPRDIDEVVHNLQDIRDNLDFGFCVFVSYSTPQSSLFVIERAYQLGFRMQPNGVLEWRVPGWDYSLLEMRTLEGEGDFNPRAAPFLQGISVGFRVPCSPSPLEVFDRALETAHACAQDVGEVITEDSERVSKENTHQYREWLREAVDILTRVGAPPGSAEALRLFGCGLSPHRV